MDSYYHKGKIFTTPHNTDNISICDINTNDMFYGKWYNLIR